MALVNFLPRSFWATGNTTKVQRRQFEEGLPLKQLRQIQRRHFEEGAVSSLSGKGDSNSAKGWSSGRYHGMCFICGTWAGMPEHSGEVYITRMGQ